MRQCLPGIIARSDEHDGDGGDSKFKHSLEIKTKCFICCGWYLKYRNLQRYFMKLESYNGI